MEIGSNQVPGCIVQLVGFGLGFTRSIIVLLVLSSVDDGFSFFLFIFLFKRFFFYFTY